MFHISMTLTFDTEKEWTKPHDRVVCVELKHCDKDYDTDQYLITMSVRIFENIENQGSNEIGR